MMSDKNSIEHNFCEFCGSRLQGGKEKEFYDRETGEPFFLRKFTCPNRRVEAWQHDGGVVKEKEKGESGVYWVTITDEQVPSSYV